MRAIDEAQNQIKTKMAYLTSYSYGKLCQELKLDDKLEITLSFFLEHIYHDKEFFYILNKLQLEYLFKYKMLLSDTETFILKYHKHVPEEKDNKVWVFSKGGKVKYHLSLDCKTLGHDFIDFRIPDDIREIGDSAIDEYRNWFTNQGYAQLFKDQKITKKDILNAYNNRYPKKYGVKPIDSDGSNLLVIELKNSGINYTEQKKDIDYLILELNELLLLYRKYFPGAGDRKIAKHSYLRNRTDEEITKKMKEIFNGNFYEDKEKLDNLRCRFKQAHEITFSITKKLIDYFKWTYNLDGKSFKPTTLENFGLECCKSCRSSQNSISIAEL